jgi:hypothetical protein
VIDPAADFYGFTLVTPDVFDINPFHGERIIENMNPEVNLPNSSRGLILIVEHDNNVLGFLSLSRAWEGPLGLEPSSAARDG